MSDMPPLKAPPVAPAWPPPLDFLPPGKPWQHDPLIISFIQHIASSLPATINGFSHEMAAQSSQTEQQLTLTHPHG
jgi:hypothetical protein